MNALTPKEQKLFSFIEEYQLEHGASPTVREMRMHMRLKSDGFVVHCLKQLVHKGALKKDDTPRGIKLLSAARERLAGNFIKVPVLGSIPAGSPVAAEENIEDWVTLEQKNLRGSKDCFILRVRGESMINAGIFEGDLCLASATKKAKTHDIVVALVDGESTLKRVIIQKNAPYLKSENPRYPDIRPLSELQVQGVVIGLFRWY